MSVLPDPSSSDTRAPLTCRAWVEVDLERLRQNFRNLAALVRPARMAAVIKSEAYGHGLVPVARTLEPEDELWGVCVVTPEEGGVLRRAGFSKPILVVGASFPEEMEQAVRDDLILAVYDSGQARALSEAAGRVGKAARAHLKLDTGLSRLASATRDAREFYREVSALPHLVFEGAYSHLADAEGLDQSYTLGQYRRFRDCLGELEQEGFRPALRHIGASAAALLLEKTRLDLVRIGISLYGFWPSEETRILHHGAAHNLAARLCDEFSDLQPPQLESLFAPVMSYRARVVQTKWLERDTKVGYGCTFETQRRTRVAILPVGYAEGYDRHLSNCGEVLLNGRRARVLGRVCMNLTVVDVTDIEGVEPGSVATLLGEDGGARITAEEWAAKIGTIQYEVVTRIPTSIPRVYR
jgi:alanine racemase